MIHGIYFRSKPKNKWSLFSVVASAEVANQELEVAMQEAQKGGNELGEAAIQIFDSPFFIPETLIQLKDRKFLGFN